jgi:hypothetical protein
MARKGPIKDCVVALRCDRETKEFLEETAEARDISVSKLIFGLISDGARLGRQRREQIRQLALSISK